MFLPPLISAPIQQTLQAPKSKKPAVDLKSPIRLKEAEAVLERVNAEMFKVEGHKPAKVTFLTGDGSSYVTRPQFVMALNKMVELSKPYFVLRARDQYCDPKIVNLPKKEKEVALHLIIRGFLAPSGTLTAGPAKYVSLGDAGDAIGYVVERWAMCTHKPSITLTPDLEVR